MPMPNRPTLFDGPPSLGELPREQRVLLMAWFLLALTSPFRTNETIPDRSYLRAIGALARTVGTRSPCKKRAPIQTALSNRRRDPRLLLPRQVSKSI